jgi:hypothetical protein
VTRKLAAIPDPAVRLAYITNRDPEVVTPTGAYALCIDEDPAVARAAVHSAALEDKDKVALLSYHPELAEHPDPRTRSEVASWPGQPKGAFARYAASDNPHVKRAGLANPECPSEVVALGAEDPDPESRRVALRHPNLPPDAVVKALASPDPHDRSAIASNGTVLSPEQRVLLMGDNQYVRAAVIEAYGDKDGALAQMGATDQHWRPRRASARVTQSEILLGQLAADPDPRVRDATEHNPHYHSVGSVDLIGT